MLFSVAGECKVRTYGGNGNGSCCVFPFMYKGETYNSCITKDAKKEGLNPDKWCSVTPNYDRDKKRGLCILENGKHYRVTIYLYISIYNPYL